MKNCKLKTQLFLSAMIIGVSILSGCSKDRVDATEEKSSYKSSDEYMDARKQAEQEYEITQDGTGPIVAQQGTKVWAVKEKLMFANGNDVTYPYTVKIVELYTPKDMIYYRMPSTSGTTLLTTAGEVRIRAFKDGQELVLRPTYTWTVEMPNAAPVTNMITYYSVGSPSVANWVNTPAGNFTVTAYGYTGEMATMGWISCAKVASTEATATFTFNSTTDNLDNVAKFLYFPNLKSLKQVYTLTAADLPVGENVKIILIGINANNIPFTYYEQKAVAQSSVISASLTANTDAGLTTLLEGL